MFLASKPRLPRSSTNLSRHTVFRRTMTGTTSNLHRPPNWKEAAPAPMAGPTFAAQSSLPKLPVPELSDTLAKLKESVMPNVRSASEYALFEKCLNEFSSGLGPKLQERLVQRAQERDHWLEEWWDDIAYLGYRESVCSPAHAFSIFLSVSSRLSSTYLTIVSWLAY